MFQQTWYRLALIATALAVAPAAFSQAPLIVNQQGQYLSSTLYQKIQTSGVASLSLGPVWQNAGEAQTFYLTPDTEKTFTANRRSRSLISSELFLGIQQSLSENLLSQIGFAIAKTGDADLSGNIWDDADPTFNNYTYQYQVNHSYIAIKAKLFANISQVIMPWIAGSIGVGFNQAHGFRNIPTIDEAVAMPNFKSNTTTTMTYALSIGVAYNVNPHWQLGLGYEFADWGKSKLDGAAGQTMHAGPTLSHLYTRGLLANLTYLA